MQQDRLKMDPGFPVFPHALDSSGLIRYNTVGG